MVLPAVNHGYDASGVALGAATKSTTPMKIENIARISIDFDDGDSVIEM